MTPSRRSVALTAGLLVLAVASPAAAAAPARKSGTVKISLKGAKQASGTFPAICGPYFMMDAPGIAKAGDGLDFEADIPEVGHLQLNSEKRTPGRSSNAGLILNTSAGSYVGDARGANKVVFGPKLDKASVHAKVKNLRVKRGSPPDVITLEAEFDCSK
jgi:hypothetical protein